MLHSNVRGQYFNNLGKCVTSNIIVIYSKSRYYVPFTALNFKTKFSFGDQSKRVKKKNRIHLLNNNLLLHLNSTEVSCVQWPFLLLYLKHVCTGVPTAALCRDNMHCHSYMWSCVSQSLIMIILTSLRAVTVPVQICTEYSDRICSDDHC